ncbi:glycosyltransferase WbsX family protein [Dactylosporangium sp. CA-233914]|uniref:glycosyltransferase WbsX family protein n=1 Tax=Dactylosporangium sp. CA-233914 TaxID=3239934 RepID=UPI003D900DFF
MTLPIDPSREADAFPLRRPAPARATAPAAQTGPTQVMAYYFPQWHIDPRNDAMFGPGWTEWDVLRGCEPRFPGHVQPKKPLYGEFDESDPVQATAIVDRALEHGVNGFIVDWYWYDNAPFLNGFLDRGLLQAQRLDEFRFALMWANHDWTDLYPACEPAPTVMLPGPNTRYHAERAFAHVLENYLTHPSYWRLGGLPYFSIYDLPSLIKGMGDVARTARLLDAFRERARAAGLAGLHLGGTVNFGIREPERLVAELGLDSATHYTWWHHTGSAFKRFPTVPYEDVHAEARDEWRRMSELLPGAYLPNVTVGWDPSPRTVAWPLDGDRGYPFTSVMTGNTPERFGAAMRDALSFVAGRGGPRVVTINAWNEWTEGSYLEPDEQHGDGYLRALRDARAEETDSTDRKD